MTDDLRTALTIWVIVFWAWLVWRLALHAVRQVGRAWRDE